MSFADLGLSPDTLRALEDVGYTEPTPIQSMAIPLVMQRRDVLGIAQTGTGKTASFTLPMIEILSSGRAKARMPRSLILAPTRELASQVADNAIQYAKYHKLSMALLIGGESMGDQQKILDKGVDILIATPGRLIDLFERGAILLRDVKMLVIDEADRMLDMGFIPDVERIVSLLPKKRQTLFFSATMDKEIGRLADAFLTHPEEIRVEPTQKSAELVDQGLVVVAQNDKREALRHLLRREPVTNAFIFCNRKRDVDILHRSLSKHGFDVIALHGDMPQYVRTERLEKFKTGEVSLLVCSDVAARGIDISDVSHVFNFDVPIHAEDYVHRIGRTGRAGKKGAAFMIATKAEKKYLVTIENMLGKPIPRVQLEGLEGLELTEEASETRARPGRNGSRNRNDKRDKNRERTDERAKPTTDRSEARPSNGDKDRDRRPARTDAKPKSNRWRDGPQSEVGDMPISDNAIGFGGYTPAFILEAVNVPMLDAEGLDDADNDEIAQETRASAPKRDARSRKTNTRRRGSGNRRRSERAGANDDAVDQNVEAIEGDVSVIEPQIELAAVVTPVGEVPEPLPAAETVEVEVPAAPKRQRAPRRKATKPAEPKATEESPASADVPTSEVLTGEDAPASSESKLAERPKRATRTRKKVEKPAADASEGGDEVEKKPRKRAAPRRKKAEPVEVPPSDDGASE